MKLKFREPTHGDVKRFRKLQREILFRIADDIGVDRLDKLTEEELLKEISKDKRKLAEFTVEMEELNYIGTIMLATGLDVEEINQMSEAEFWQAYNKAKEVLGGTVEDFLEPYEGAITSKVMKMERESSESLQETGGSS